VTVKTPLLSVKPRPEAVLPRVRLGSSIAMGFGTSLFLIALGAILKFAVHATARGFSIQTVGVILMIVGSAGLVISLMWMAVLAERRDDRSYDERMRTRRLS
jgi:hypothetical protein